MYTWMSVYMYTCMLIYLCILIHTCPCADTYIYIYIQMVLTCMRGDELLNIYICSKYTHAHNQAYTQKDSFYISIVYVHEYIVYILYIVNLCCILYVVFCNCIL